jgi:hypothetical protein
MEREANVMTLDLTMIKRGVVVEAIKRKMLEKVQVGQRLRVRQTVNLLASHALPAERPGLA